MIRFLLRERCALCRKRLQGDDLLCEACAALIEQEYRAQGLRFSVAGADGTAAALRYRGLARYAMLRFKFWHNRPLYRFFAAETARALEKLCGEWKPDLITYVPLGLWHLFRRGYNQSELIARFTARRLGLPCVATLRKRPLQGRQSKRTAAERRRLAPSAFFARKNLDLTGKHVIILDDIAATGATLSACCKLLRAAGATRVYAVAVLHTERISSGQNR